MTDDKSSTPGGARGRAATGANHGDLAELLAAVMRHADTPADLHTHIGDWLVSQPQPRIDSPDYIRRALGNADAPGAAGGAGAGAEDDGGPLTLRLPLTIEWKTYMGRDTPALKVQMATATKGLFVCEGLFWAVAQLSEPSGESGSESRPAEYFEALEHLGIIGRAVAGAVREELDKADLITRR
jgi:hypothetical protein